MSSKWVNVDFSSEAAPARGHARSVETDSIVIEVGEPVKQGEGMQAYISYKISTSTDRRQFQKSTFSVVRRFSDFVWLHTSLCSLFPGVVVPPLPEKLLVGRFSPEFIESRRRALHLFLCRCAVHPEIQHSEYLTVFLEGSDEALSHFKTEVGAKSKGKNGGGLFQWFDDTIVATISSTLGAQSLAVEKLKTTTDIQVEDIAAYMDSLEPIIQSLSKHAHGLTKRAREIADGLFEFGVALTLLGQAEENESLQTALSHVGTCADKLSVLAAEHAEKEVMLFEEPILDYIRLVQAVKAALVKRNEVRGQYHGTVLDLEAKQTALQKAQAKGSPPEKVEAASNDVNEAKRRVDTAKLEHDMVTDRVLREVDRFKQEKLSDFKRIVLDYIQLQIAYNRKVEDEWAAVIPKLQMIQIESPGKALATPPPPPTAAFKAPASTTDVAL
ncbi:sorting nexin [Achlya hypogyna]|uniref:Sorting nexin n=1 Tax=Achlya hypogyna TaxID=1202772 RepID=A0A1V9YGR1_ACHHY|nr:sorting nexin [Achlya hypogyna]